MSDGLEAEVVHRILSKLFVIFITSLYIVCTVILNYVHKEYLYLCCSLACAARI